LVGGDLENRAPTGCFGEIEIGKYDRTFIIPALENFGIFDGLDPVAEYSITSGTGISNSNPFERPPFTFGLPALNDAGFSSAASSESTYTLNNIDPSAVVSVPASARLISSGFAGLIRNI